MNKLALKIGITTALAATVLATAPAQAGHREWNETRYDYARVIDVDPVYREVRYSEPREVCREEPVTERRVYGGAPDPGAILLGAAIGGVIGHQFGHGHGRDVSTAVGAAIGAGHGAAASSASNSRVVERDVYRTTCRDVREVRYEQRVDYYDVTYRYHGRTYRTRMDYDPGNRVRVKVYSDRYGDVPEVRG